MSREIGKLILNMKNENSLWGCRRIADELKKLGIDLHHTTVNRILQDFRTKGRIAVTGSWSRFLRAHWDSMYAMDFMTIDTLLGKRFFLLVVLKLSTREINYWDMTGNPTDEFVRQRIMELQVQNPPGMSLIYDIAPQFTLIDNQSCGMNGVNTSVAAPIMNVYVERVVGTIRREVLIISFCYQKDRSVISFQCMSTAATSTVPIKALAVSRTEKGLKISARL